MIVKEVSPSNKTTCNVCKKPILKGYARVKRTIPTEEYGGVVGLYDTAIYYHLPCYKKVKRKLLAEAIAKAKKEVLI